MMRTRKGLTLIELLVSLVMTLIIGAGLFAIFTNTFESRDFTVGQGTAETVARTPIDDLADHLRNAQQYHSVEPPGSVSQSWVIANGTATSVTYYKSNSSSDTVKYWLNGTDLDRTEGGATSTVLNNVQALEFQYFKTPSLSGNYNNSSVVQTTDIHAPTAAELPLLSVIKIRANVNIDGYQRELACLVRLRNSPYKVHL